MCTHISSFLGEKENQKEASRVPPLLLGEENQRGDGSHVVSTFLDSSFWKTTLLKGIDEILEKKDEKDEDLRPRPELLGWARARARVVEQQHATTAWQIVLFMLFYLFLLKWAE